MSNLSFKYRLYPNKKQQEQLQWTLDRARELYNAALQERRDAYRMAGKSVNYYDQANQLPDIKQLREEYKDIHSQVLQDVLKRVEKAMKAFFRRVKNGETPGYPRYQGKHRYDSFTYPQGGYSLTHDNHLCLSKIGSLKIKLHRPVRGTVKTLSIKREGEQWYASFSCEIEQCNTLPYTDDAVGVDLGLTHFATLSTGETIENPRYYRCGEAKLRKAQEHLSRCTRGSHRREKARKHVAKAHRKAKNQRTDFLHKQSRQLVNTYETIVFEDLHSANLSHRPSPKQDEDGIFLPNGAAAKSGLNKSILDAGWGLFVLFCSYKAANAGTNVIAVNPRYTSQLCSGCGAVRKKTLAERWHSCECGCELDRDHNAAINILRLGRSHQEES